jgi:hypothetical protein
MARRFEVGRVGLSLAFLACACGSSGSGGSTGGSGGSAGSSGNAGSLAAACTVPSPPPSQGSCVTVGGSAQSTCNPLTGTGCSTGTFCDYDPTGSHYQCVPVQHPPTGASVCAACTYDGNCGPGMVCNNNGPTPGICLALCCTPADCGTGTCNTSSASVTFGRLSAALPSGVGLCTTGP